jgi:hypothetical protein
MRRWPHGIAGVRIVDVDVTLNCNSVVDWVYAGVRLGNAIACLCASTAGRKVHGPSGLTPSPLDANRCRGSRRRRYREDTVLGHGVRVHTNALQTRAVNPEARY